ncbi:MAG TPA: DMT family transporter [Capsulimonadaceae bacterium]|nr:DMT family transporter [Capsulimonadaceae bacterium]
MRLLVVLLVILSGLFLPLQIGVNSRLRTAIDSPIMAALISFLVGTAILLLATWLGIAGGRGAGLAALKSAPGWAYLGGLCGAFYVLISIIALPRVGAAVTVASAVLGQQVASLAIDTFGWLDVPRIPLTWPRVAGAALLLAGVLLLQKK